MPYFDYAATTPLLAEAKAAMLAAFDVVGNAAATHSYGRSARRRLEEARESIAADLGASPHEVVFTSGGTEADVLAISGLVAANPQRPVVAVSAIEHAAVGAYPGLKMALPVTEAGVLDVAAAAGLLAADAGRIGGLSVMAANNETGVIQPIAELVELARGRWTHTDAVQAVVATPISFGDLGVDLLSLSAHKLGGPVGIGALLVRQGCPIQAPFWGGGQERKLRSGTQPVALAAGFAAALRQTVADRAAVNSRLAPMVESFTAQMLALGGVRHIGANAPRTGRIVNLTFANISVDDLWFLLDQAGFAVSTGSACSSGVFQPSNTLIAMGCERVEASSSLRFSFGTQTTPTEVEALTHTVIDIVTRLVESK